MKWTQGNDEATHILEKNFEDTTGLLVNEAGDALHTATTSETTDSLQGAGEWHG